MAKGVGHFFKDGSLHEGGSHKMPNGEVHSGAKHTSSSRRLFHIEELGKAAKEKAMNYGSKKPKNKKPVSKKAPVPKKGYKNK